MILAIDITAVIISAIGAVVSLGTVALTIILTKRVKSYHKEVNGMKSELVEAVRGRAQSEGEQKGAADNQAITDAKPQEQK